LVPGISYAGDHDRTHSHDEGLHFAHPLIAESPSPDTKIRFDYFFRDIKSEGEDATENEVRVEAEYAFHRTFSVEVDVPFVFLDPKDGSSRENLKNVEIGLKFANFAFEEHNLLLGYGIEFGLPTGDDKKGIGSNNIFEIEPFLSLGYKWQGLEVVAFASFGIPTNQEEGEEVETELGYNLSFLYHLTPRVSGLLEFDGETVLSGDEEGETVANITPGIIFRPLANPNLAVGLGVSVPLSDEEEFDIQTTASVFYHF
jgi:hypothetical protein